MAAGLKVRTTQGKLSMSFRGTRYWNDLPLSVREKASVSCFRRTLISQMLIE